MSEFRVEKGKAGAILTLSGGSIVRGCFFVASSSATMTGPERVKDLLTGETDFFPFEIVDAGQPRTRLYNRAHVVMAELVDADEPRRDPGYEVATRRSVSLRLSNGAHLQGTVLVHRPHGRDRLSDFARSNEPFRYLEVPGATLIINVSHIVELSETES